MDAISAKCGHLKRRLKRNERLTGELLEFALDVAWDEEIARKLIAGETLTDYERHIMVDVVLLHVRLAPRGRIAFGYSIIGFVQLANGDLIYKMDHFLTRCPQNGDKNIHRH